MSQLDTFNQQNWANQQAAAMQNIQSGLWGGYSYGTTASPGYANIVSYQLAVPEPPKKKRLIVELREELRNWHGDLEN